MMKPRGPIDLAERPFILFWEITRACALACRHCRATAQHRRDPDELDHPESLALLDEIGRLDPVMLVLTGGDPMMRRDLEELIRYSTKECGIHTSLSPSATPELLRTDLEALKAAGLQRLSLSLDGATREVHDAFRGVSHTFDRTIEAVRMSHEAGVPVQDSVRKLGIRRNLASIALLYLVSVAAHAALEVRGVVVDESGAPVVRASVELHRVC